MGYYNIKSLEQYFKHYRKSVKKPEVFWSKVARRFEWEKKWHPELADPEIALPHFANWFRKNCTHD